MDWINQNMIEFLLIVGMLLLGVEVLVLGFSTFVLFFVGLAALLTAGLIYIEVVPSTMLSAVLSLGVLSALGATFFFLVDSLIVWPAWSCATSLTENPL